MHGHGVGKEFVNNVLTESLLKQWSTTTQNFQMQSNSNRSLINSFSGFEKAFFTLAQILFTLEYVKFLWSTIFLMLVTSLMSKILKVWYAVEIPIKKF